MTTPTDAMTAKLDAMAERAEHDAGYWRKFQMRPDVAEVFERSAVTLREAIALLHAQSERIAERDAMIRQMGENAAEAAKAYVAKLTAQSEALAVAREGLEWMRDNCLPGWSAHVRTRRPLCGEVLARIDALTTTKGEG